MRNVPNDRTSAFPPFLQRVQPFTFAAGNLFGVSLSTLLLRDSQLTSEENNIPLVFQKILDELTKRGVKEEGILRVGGHKQKASTKVDLKYTTVTNEECICV